MVNKKKFRDIFPIKLMKAPGRGSNPKIELLPPGKLGERIIDGNCGFRMNY
jgi:hypothetical protein